jgi:hypothetical protein
MAHVSTGNPPETRIPSPPEGLAPEASAGAASETGQPSAEGCPVPGVPFLRIIPGGRMPPRTLHPRTPQARESRQDAEGRDLEAAIAASRALHLYVSGLPGTGKSTVLLHHILEDVQAGRGCVVLDPHGDLITAVLARFPREEAACRRVLLFDPADVDWPVGLDVLSAETEPAQELAVQFMLELYEELFLPDQQGPVLHQSLRNGLRLVMQTGGVLPELPLLFSDPAFLKDILRKCQDPWVRHYFERVWLKISESSRGEYLAYFLSKISGFIEDRTLRNILGQHDPVNLREFLEGGGVLLANLARGETGAITSRLLGMILLHKLECLALERSTIPPEVRRPVHVYVDEFHEFTVRGFGRFLSSARKFNIGLALAHQRLDMLPVALQDAVLGSVGHLMLFRQGGDGRLSRAASDLVWPRFGERDLTRLPNYQSIARVTAPAGGVRVGRLKVPLPGRETPRLVERIRELSRQQFARPRRDVECKILHRLGWDKEAPANTPCSTAGKL